MSMQRSYAEIKAESESLNLKVVEGKRKAKRPFILALQEYHLNQRLYVTFGLKHRLSMESPMLAKPCTGLKSSEIAEIYESDDWVFEEKFNGIRMEQSNSQDGMEAFSRGLSVTDYLPVCYTDKIDWQHYPIVEPTEEPEYVLDCEIVSINPNISTIMGNKGVVTETELQAVTALLALNLEDSIRIQREIDHPLRFRVFDCLFYKGEDLRPLPYWKRVKVARKITTELASKGLPFIKTTIVRDRKEEYLEHLWSLGKEGVIAKNIHKEYIDRESRPRDGWIKFKRTTTGVLGDTIDAYVTGFELGDEKKGFAGIVGSIHFTVNLTKKNGEVVKHHIARCINVELVERKAMTIQGADGPELDPSYYGRVAEVEGQAVSARALRLTHPRILRWREDKTDEDCVMAEEDLRGMVV